MLAFAHATPCFCLPCPDGSLCVPKLAWGKEMHEKIAESQLVILPSSGHMTFVDQPEQFLKAVLDFVEH
jgi:pimeloyl-ACP methyl ester carboxylesterase